MNELNLNTELNKKSWTSRFFYSLKYNLKEFSLDFLMLYCFISLLYKSFAFLSMVSFDTENPLKLFNGANLVYSYSVCIFFIFLFISFSFLFKGRHHMRYLLGLTTVISILLLLDIWYYRGFLTVPSLYLLKQTANLDNLEGSILSMAHPIDVVFVADLIPLYVITILKRKWYKGYKRNTVLFLFTFLISFYYTMFIPIKYDLFKIYDSNHFLFNFTWKPSRTLGRLSPIGYHVYDAYAYINDSQRLKLTPKDHKDIKEFYKNNREDLKENTYFGAFKGKNLLVIQWESLENFPVMQRIEGQEITPNLNKLVGNSIYFSNYNEEVNEGTSSDADLMTNTSIYPLRRGSTFFRYADTKYNSMPKILQSMGYSTTAMHPDNGAFWNWMPGLKSIGFEKCIDTASFKVDESIGLGLSDGSYLRQAVPMIAKEKQPFYHFMVTLTSHAPFDLPKKYRELPLSKTLDESHLGGYLQSIHYTDMELGKFMDNLSKEGLLDNTVVVVYGDHCGIHKYYPDEVKEMNPPSFILDNGKRIPLIIYSKGYKGEEIKTNGGQIDLMPTLLYLLGTPKDKYVNTCIGKNLLNTNKNFSILNDRSVVGDTSDKKAVKLAQEALDVSDKIIKSNYYK